MLQSYVEYEVTHPYSIHNLPYGVFYTDSDQTHRCGVAIGDLVLDLKALTDTPYYPDFIPKEIFTGTTLNAFMALDRSQWTAFRHHLQKILAKGSPLACSNTFFQQVFIDRRSARMCLPAQIGDYTDFYASLEHAYNCGVLIRGEDNALQPNWRHLPVAYHGRASSIVVSGTPIHRPMGQILPEPGAKQPILAASQKLDYELEVGFFYGGAATKLGQRLSPAQAAEHVFGAVLLCDWSARDIQTWEYVPLGPFLSKNFATTISPWIVTVDALEAYKCEGYKHDPPLLPYLEDPDNTTYDFPIQVQVRGQNDEKFTMVGKSNLKHTYYTIRQMIAHHTTTGCPLNPGDLIGTGTISAPTDTGYGSLLEKSRNGKRPFPIGTSGETMTFLRDGDTVCLTGLAESLSENWSVGFGFEGCEGTILPAIPF